MAHHPIRSTVVAILSAVASIAAVAGLPSAGVAQTGAQSAQMRSCNERAAQRGLAESDREAFMKQCMTGPMPATTSTLTPGARRPTREVTAPSGADRNVRSRQCSAEADRRGLHDSLRAAFRLKCLATAAPVRNVGTQAHDTAPTAVKPQLGAVVEGQQH